MNSLKYIYLPAIMLLGWMAQGCSQIDEQVVVATADEYILFDRPWIEGSVGTFDAPTSRANLATSISAFKVWGYCVSNKVGSASEKDANSAQLDWDVKQSLCTSDADVFNGIDVTVDNGFARYTTPKTWVSVSTNAEARYSFFALANYPNEQTYTMGKGIADSNNSHGPQLTLRLPHSGGDLSTPLDVKSQPDLLLADTYDHQKRDGRVNLQFSHVLTGLRFKFHNHTSEKTLKIHGMSFAGTFYRSAYFDFLSTGRKMTTNTEDTYSGTFTLYPYGDNQAPQEIAPGEEEYLLTDGTPVNMLLLPNPNAELSASDEFFLGMNKTITIRYSLVDEQVKETTIDVRLNYAPQANSLHTAHLNFVGNDFVITFQADNSTNWVNGSDNAVEIK